MRALAQWLVGSAICMLAASVLLALTALGTHPSIRYSKVLLLLICIMNTLAAVVFVYILTRVERRSLSSTLTAHAPLLSSCCDFDEKEVNGKEHGSEVQVVVSEVNELKQDLLARKSQQQKLRREAEETIDSALSHAKESQRRADQQAMQAQAQAATVLALQNEKDQLTAQVQHMQAVVDDHAQALAEEQQRVREQQTLDQGSSISTSATPNEELASLQVRYQELTAVSESKDTIYRKMAEEVEDLKQQLAEKHSEEQQFSEMRSWLKMRIDALENSSRIAQQKIEELKMSTEGTNKGQPYSPALSPIRDDKPPRHLRQSGASSPSSPTDLPLSFSQEVSTSFQYKAQSLSVPPSVSIEDRYAALRHAHTVSAPPGRRDDNSHSPTISYRPSPQEQSPAASWLPSPQQSHVATVLPMPVKAPEIILMTQRTSSQSPSISPPPSAHVPSPPPAAHVTTTTTRPRSRQSSYHVPARTASPVWAEAHPQAVPVQKPVSDRMPTRSTSPAWPGEAPRLSGVPPVQMQVGDRMQVRSTIPALSGEVGNSAKSISPPPLQGGRGTLSPTPAVQLSFTATPSSATTIQVGNTATSSSTIQVGNTVQCISQFHVPSWSMTPIQVTASRSPRRIQSNSPTTAVSTVSQSNRRLSPPPRPPNPRSNVARP